MTNNLPLKRSESLKRSVTRKLSFVTKENNRAVRLSLHKDTLKQNSLRSANENVLRSLQDEVDINGLNSFHRAAADHNVNLVMELMEIYPEAEFNAKLWLDVPSKHGITPLHFACMYRHKGKLQDREKFIEFLLENGADPNNCNQNTFFTPLHWACRYGDVSIV